MPKAKANSIEIEYETFGNPSARPLLLIMGLGGQLIYWPEEFCQELARRGHYVIIYDNRDVGLSTKFDQAGEPDVYGAYLKIQKGDQSGVPYRLEDMVDDGAGLLEALGIPSAHICGMSMGGMIAQIMPLRHPSKVLSLVSIMSTPGNPDFLRPQPEGQAAVISRPADWYTNLEYQGEALKILNGDGFPFDDDWIRKVLIRGWDRCLCPQGTDRHTIAILAQKSRKADLASVKVPTLVIHGTKDPLVPVEGGKDTAASIPGAKLLLIEGMGHGLPREAWPRILEAITELTNKV